MTVYAAISWLFVSYTISAIDLHTFDIFPAKDFSSRSHDFNECKNTSFFQAALEKFTVSLDCAAASVFLFLSISGISIVLRYKEIEK
jgi:hypothetical protein